MSRMDLEFQNRQQVLYQTSSFPGGGGGVSMEIGT